MLGLVGWIRNIPTLFRWTDFLGTNFRMLLSLHLMALFNIALTFWGTAVTPQLDWSFAEGYFINLANDSFVDITPTERYQVETDDDWDVNFRLTLESMIRLFL